MSYKLSFAERAKLAMEILSKQPPVTLEEAREQARKVRERSTSKTKKQRALALVNGQKLNTISNFAIIEMYNKTSMSVNPSLFPFILIFSPLIFNLFLINTIIHYFLKKSNLQQNQFKTELKNYDYFTQTLNYIISISSILNGFEYIFKKFKN